METWYIYLKCYEASGYYTGLITTSEGQEVGVHPYRDKAYKFNARETAMTVAKTLKNKFSCIISYEIKNR